MNRSHQYIINLFDRLPAWELEGENDRSLLKRLASRLADALNISSELRHLFTVRGAADLAINLLWIVRKVETDPHSHEPTAAEERLVFESFREVLGGEAPAPPPTPRPAVVEPTEFVPTGFVPEEGLIEFHGPLSAGSNPDVGDARPVTETPHEETREEELELSSLMDKFLEAVQTGSDDRLPAADDLEAQCRAVATSTVVEQDLSQYAEMLMDFLRYVTSNELLDDVRVMNMVSSLQDPINQWVRTPPDARTGILEPALEMLRGYRAMFE